MKFGVYSVHDAKTNVYSAPFFSQNDNVARRQFGDLAKDGQTLISKHPDDFNLVRIGTWCDDKGQLTDEQTKTLANAGDFHEPES